MDIFSRKSYEDIFTYHQIEENVYKRIIIIHGDIPVDSELKDGSIDVIASQKTWYVHWCYWYKYLHDPYLENEVI